MATKSTIKKKPLLDLEKFQTKPSLFAPEPEPQMSIAKNKPLYQSTPQPSAPSTPEVIRDAETGELTGVVTPSGKRLFGLSPEDVKGLAETYASRMNVPVGTVDSEKVQEARRKQQLAIENQQLANQVGATQEIPQEEEQQRGNLLTANPLQLLAPELNIGQALGEGIAQGGIVAAGGAAAGLVTGGAASIPLAIAGGIGGFINGVRSSISRQLKEGVSERGQTISKAETNLKALITDTKRNPQNAASNLEMFNYQLALIEQEHSALKRETQRDLNKFLAADGNTELKKYELFYMPGGQRDFLSQKMATAILNPNLANVDLLSPEDITEYEE